MAGNVERELYAGVRAALATIAKGALVSGSAFTYTYTVLDEAILAGPLVQPPALGQAVYVALGEPRGGRVRTDLVHDHHRLQLPVQGWVAPTNTGRLTRRLEALDLFADVRLCLSARCLLPGMTTEADGSMGDEVSLEMLRAGASQVHTNWATFDALLTLPWRQARPPVLT